MVHEQVGGRSKEEGSSVPGRRPVPLKAKGFLTVCGSNEFIPSQEAAQRQLETRESGSAELIRQHNSCFPESGRCSSGKEGGEVTREKSAHLFSI